MLSQDIMSPLALKIIGNFSEEYQKYKTNHMTSAMLAWFREQGIHDPCVFNMKNNDVVISQKGSGAKEIKGPSIVQYKDKTVYVGHMAQSQRSGFGFRSFQGSSLIYAGGYMNDVKTGQGRLFSIKSNQFVFKGEYANDFRNGEGHLEKEDGGIYDGNYFNDKMHGFGKMKWANGDSYEGNFKMEQKEGRGIMKWENKDKYEGDFVNNTMNGRGKYTWKNGEFFEGDFKDGLMCGKGVMDYTSAINIKGSGADVHSIRQMKFEVLGEAKFANKNHAM